MFISRSSEEFCNNNWCYKYIMLFKIIDLLGNLMIAPLKLNNDCGIQHYHFSGHPSFLICSRDGKSGIATISSRNFFFISCTFFSGSISNTMTSTFFPYKDGGNSTLCFFSVGIIISRYILIAFVPENYNISLYLSQSWILESNINPYWPYNHNSPFFPFLSVFFALIQKKQQYPNGKTNKKYPCQ